MNIGGDRKRKCRDVKSCTRDMEGNRTVKCDNNIHVFAARSIQKYCDHQELPVIKVSTDRGRYRVGPYLMPRPFASDEENLIKFCMDENLSNREMLFQTNFSGITRNDIMSLTPRSPINAKVVSAISELLPVQATVNVGHSKFSLFLPTYHVDLNNPKSIQCEDSIAGYCIEQSFAVRQFKCGAIYLNDIGLCEKVIANILLNMGILFSKCPIQSPVSIFQIISNSHIHFLSIGIHLLL